MVGLRERDGFLATPSHFCGAIMPTCHPDLGFLWRLCVDTGAIMTRLNSLSAKSSRYYWVLSRHHNR
jgi:hypothetical protein